MKSKANNISSSDVGPGTLLGLAVIIFAAYIPNFVWMWDRWFSRDSYYSHGILVPLVSAYLIWQEREVLKTLPRHRHFGGLIWALGALAVHAVSSLFRVGFASGFSLVLLILGICLYLYGPAVFRRLAFPLGFLAFMVPLPLVVIVNLSFQMKLFAAQLAAWVLRSMGIFALQEGSIILMRHTQVIVDDVCSGLRSLIALLALGALFAYWFRGVWWKKGIVFLMAIPIAIITNVCRVIVLSLISEIWGAEAASGFVHDATGMMVFVLAFLMLSMVNKILE